VLLNEDFAIVLGDEQTFDHRNIDYFIYLSLFLGTAVSIDSIPADIKYILVEER
jgi:hypothetical protein